MMTQILSNLYFSRALNQNNPCSTAAFYKSTSANPDINEGMESTLG